MVGTEMEKEHMETEMVYEISFDSKEVGEKGFNTTTGSSYVGCYTKTYTKITRKQWKAIEELVKTFGKEVEW